MCFVVAMKKKIKLEFHDRSGTKHSLTIEGEFTVDKLQKLLDYAEIVAGSNQSSKVGTEVHDSKIKRLLDVITTQLQDRVFDSRDIWKAYNEIWPDDFSLGAVSTYLARLTDRGTLERSGSPSHWIYRIKPSPTLPQ